MWTLHGKGKKRCGVESNVYVLALKILSVLAGGWSGQHSKEGSELRSTGTSKTRLLTSTPTSFMFCYLEGHFGYPTSLKYCLFWGGKSQLSL
jgi:hypothetical protein